MDRHKEKNPGFLAILADLVFSCVKRVSDLVHLAALEAQLALKTLVLIAVLVFLMGSVITALWLSVLTLIFVYLLSLHFSLLSASLVLVTINILVLSLICYVIIKVKTNLFFPGTMEQLGHSSIPSAELEHERITSKN